MKFHRHWFPTFDDQNNLIGFYPALKVSLLTVPGRFIEETFVVDSGADVSMASRQLCDDLGLRWEDGVPSLLHGISPRPECAVMTRIHEVEIVIDELEQSLRIPICFAETQTTSLLGRAGFFDFFRVEFDQPFRTTTFEFLLDDAE